MLGVAAPLVLGRLGHLDHTPQAAAYLWLLAALGALSAVVLAGLLLLVGSSHLMVDLAALLATCSMALRAALLTAVTGGLLAGGLVAGARAWRAARGHRELLALAGRSQPGLPGVTLLDHPTPLAYCLPGRVGGRPGPIVLTTATLQRLDPGQLQAVLAHEHAHQARRHHAVL